MSDMNHRGFVTANGLVMASLLALAGCATSDAPNVGARTAALDPGTTAVGSGSSAGVEDTSETETVAEAAAPLSYSAYIALGDSFSSANGVANDMGACRRGDGAWPNLLSPSLTLQQQPVVLAACSGATTVGITGVEKEPAQIEKLKAVSNLDSALVTITIGGNDVDVATELLTCADVGASCATPENEARIKGKIDAVRSSLLSTFNALRAAAPKATIVAVGYPNTVGASPTASCTDGKSYDLDASERAMIRRSIQYMNTVIASAADDAKINAITKEVEQHFEGFELCSGAEKPYFHFMDANLDLTGWFHPNAAGNAAYAAAVLEGLSTVVKKIGTVNEPGTTGTTETTTPPTTEPTTPAPGDGTDTEMEGTPGGASTPGSEEQETDTTPTTEESEPEGTPGDEEPELPQAPSDEQSDDSEPESSP